MRTLRTGITASLLVSVFLVLLAGCPGRAPSLDGTWLDGAKEWGLRFQDGRVTEIEAGQSEKTADYELDVSVTPNRLIIRDPEMDTPIYSLIEVAGDRIRMTHLSAEIPKDFDSGGTVIELFRQK